MTDDFNNESYANYKALVDKERQQIDPNNLTETIYKLGYKIDTLLSKIISQLDTLTKEDFNPNNVTCSIDDKEVDCNTWKDDSFLDDLYIRGFDYDKEKDWYVREWTTNTREGVESTLEVYKQDKSTGDWKSLMFGNDGSLFYQEDV